MIHVGKCGLPNWNPNVYCFFPTILSNRLEVTYRELSMLSGSPNLQRGPKKQVHDVGTPSQCPFGLPFLVRYP